MSQEMQDGEIGSLCCFILELLDRIVASLDGFDVHELNWRPSVRNGNSLYGLALHALGNTEGDILGHLRGQAVERDRKQELATTASSVTVLFQRLQELRPVLETFLLSLTPADMEREYELLGRGAKTGRETLLMTVRHLAQHLGHMDLIRDLLQSMV